MLIAQWIMFFTRTFLIALTTDGYDAAKGTIFEQYDDNGYVFVCRTQNGWMTKEIYYQIVRFAARLIEAKMDKKQTFIDDVCTGHNSLQVKSLLFNGRYKHDSIPGGGTGLYFFVSFVS